MLTYTVIIFRQVISLVPIHLHHLGSNHLHHLISDKSVDPVKHGGVGRGVETQAGGSKQEL